MSAKSTVPIIPKPEPRGYIRQRELLDDYLPFSAATLWRRVKSGDFPKPKRLSPKVTAWSKAEVQDWLDSRESV